MLIRQRRRNGAPLLWEHPEIEGSVPAGPRTGPVPCCHGVEEEAQQRRRSQRSLGPIEIFTSGSGMMVEGSPTAVSAFVDQMLDATKEVGGRSRHFVVDGSPGRRQHRSVQPDTPSSTSSSPNSAASC